LTFDGLRNGTRKKILSLALRQRERERERERERKREGKRKKERKAEKEETIRSVAASVCPRKIFARRVEFKHVGLSFSVWCTSRVFVRRAMPKARSSARSARAKARR